MISPAQLQKGTALMANVRHMVDFVSAHPERAGFPLADDQARRNGVSYHAMVGPFDTTEEAEQFCGNLMTAGGQCVVRRN